MNNKSWDTTQHDLIVDVLSCETILTRVVNQQDQLKIQSCSLFLFSLFDLPFSLPDFRPQNSLN